jgi:hypothetical protein
VMKSSSDFGDGGLGISVIGLSFIG